MYESFYHLKEKPFSLLPDPDYLYLSGKHGTALALLEYSLLNQTGFCVISGEIGAGKTTLIRRILAQCANNVSVGLISNTHRSFGELLGWISMAFGLEYRDRTKPQLYEAFIQFLIDQYAKNRQTVLVIDEAQNMSPETLEELRMLSNINADKDQVLQVILVGQPGLRETLRHPGLVQFAQRIAVDYHLDSLDCEETSAYIHHRLTIAGGQSDIFDDEACNAVFRYSNGTPRLINLLCDSALVYAYAEHRSSVDASVVHAVMRDRESHGALLQFASQSPGEPLQAADLPAPSEGCSQKIIAPVASEVSLPTPAATESPDRQGHAESVEEEQRILHRSVAAAVGAQVATSPLVAGPSGDATDPSHGGISKLIRMESWTRNSTRTNSRHRAAGAQDSQTDASAISGNVSAVPLSTQAVAGSAQDGESPPIAAEAQSLNDRAVTGLDGEANMAGDNPTESKARERRARGFWGATIALGFVAGLLIAAILIGAVYLRLGLNVPVAVGSQPLDSVSGPAAPRPSIVVGKTPMPVAGPEPAPGPPVSGDSTDSARLQVLKSERDAALAETRALKRERDAAMAVARARERAADAELRAARAEAQAQQEQAEMVARTVKERAKHSAETESPAVRALPKQTADSASPPPVATQAVKPKVVAPVAPPPTAAKSGPAKDSAPLKFSANPCKGPSAIFLSTCKE
ncbi:MAG: ExeA family protein [Acidiferrobacterales bacterium]